MQCIYNRCHSTVCLQSQPWHSHHRGACSNSLRLHTSPAQVLVGGGNAGFTTFARRYGGTQTQTTKYLAPIVFNSPRAACRWIHNKSGSFSGAEIMTCTTAMAELHYYNPWLLQQLSKVLVSRKRLLLPQLNPQQLLQLLHAIAGLGYSNLLLLERIGDVALDPEGVVARAVASLEDAGMAPKAVAELVPDLERQMSIASGVGRVRKGRGEEGVRVGRLGMASLAEWGAGEVVGLMEGFAALRFQHASLVQAAAAVAMAGGTAAAAGGGGGGGGGAAGGAAGAGGAAAGGGGEGEGAAARGAAAAAAGGGGAVAAAQNMHANQDAGDAGAASAGGTNQSFAGGIESSKPWAARGWSVEQVAALASALSQFRAVPLQLLERAVALACQHPHQLSYSIWIKLGLAAALATAEPAAADTEATAEPAAAGGRAGAAATAAAAGALQLFADVALRLREVLPSVLLDPEQVVAAGPELLLLMQAVWALNPVQQQQALDVSGQQPALLAKTAAVNQAGSGSTGAAAGGGGSGPAAAAGSGSGGGGSSAAAASGGSIGGPAAAAAGGSDDQGGVAAAGDGSAWGTGVMVGPAWHLGLNSSLVGSYLAAAGQQLSGEHQELVRSIALGLRELLGTQQQGGVVAGAGIAGLTAAAGAGGRGEGRNGCWYEVHACYQPPGTPLLLPVVLLPRAAADRAAPAAAAATTRTVAGAAAAAASYNTPAAAAGGNVLTQTEVLKSRGATTSSSAITAAEQALGRSTAVHVSVPAAGVVLLLLRKSSSISNKPEQLMSWPWLLKMCCERGLGWRVGVLGLEEWEEAGELPQVGRQYKRQQLLIAALKGAAAVV